MPSSSMPTPRAGSQARTGNTPVLLPCSSCTARSPWTSWPRKPIQVEGSLVGWGRPRCLGTAACSLRHGAQGACGLAASRRREASPREGRGALRLVPRLGQGGRVAGNRGCRSSWTGSGCRRTHACSRSPSRRTRREQSCGASWNGLWSCPWLVGGRWMLTPELTA